MEVDDAADAAQHVGQLVWEQEEAAYAADLAREVEDRNTAQDEAIEFAAARMDEDTAEELARDEHDEWELPGAAPNWSDEELPVRDPRETREICGHSWTDTWKSIVKPLPRVPPTEGLNGKYWTVPLNFTMWSQCPNPVTLSGLDT